MGDGEALSLLWRYLWELHETWGGYESSRAPSVYAAIAARIDDHTRLRKGGAVLGPHLHLVARDGDKVIGQVEAWCERLGGEAETPTTIDIRSLIVAPAHHRRGVGEKLLVALEHEVAALFPPPTRVLFSAEVHASNVASSFYEHLGFRAICFSCRIDARTVAPAPSAWVARPATFRDAAAIAALDTLLSRRRASTMGDYRFDRPTPPSPEIIRALELHLAGANEHDPCELIATGPRGEPVGSATLGIAPLELPFVPQERALLGRFSIRDGASERDVTHALIREAARIARGRGARHLELTDLEPPGSALHDAAIELSAEAWSCVYARERQ